ncbi:transglycosylase SLT domain-containing protein [Streptomyces sp. NPDC051639]|uniref:transglycosylase SLT domain-containing protein n=1 Tax=Streptomyces sp. NPDC051639 TaxID=3155671 RepID=UPI0034337738
MQQAAERLAEANRKVADQTRAVADAQQKARDAQVQAAEQIASAERGVEAARLSSVDTTTKAVTKADEYRKALAKLTPDQRKLYDSIAGPTGLTKAFKDWSTSLQPAVLPLFVRGVDGAKNSLPGLTPLVHAAADAVGILMDKASKELKNPFWKGFKRDINSSAKPAIVGLGVSFGNILKGMAGIVDAFLPHMDGISRTMQRITGRFANWGKNLKGSPAFERFLKYVSDTAPQVGEIVGKAADALLSFSQAIAPTSAVVFAVIGPLLDGVKWLSENMPGFVQTMWGLYVVSKAVAVATKAWAIAQGLFDSAMAIAALETWSFAGALTAIGWTELVALITAIVVAIAALVAGIIWAFKNVGWVHDAFTAAWTGIKVATLFLWNSVLKPTFDVIGIGLKGIGTAAMWLWTNAIKPAFEGIWLVARILVAVLVTAVVTPIVLAFRLLGSVATWLWANALKPVFGWISGGLSWLGSKFTWLFDHAVKPSADGIAGKASWLWSKALAPTFRFVWDGIRWLGDKFRWLFDNAVKPSADWIAGKASWLHDKALKPAFDKMKSAVRLVGEAFGDAKDAIKKAWDAVAGIVAKPVNFVIDTVYTHGVKAVWDKVAKFVGLDALPKAPTLLQAPAKFAQGGRTRGGIPGVDSIPILAMQDEFIIRRDSARKIGFGNLAHMNATGELPRFAGGGIVGALGSAFDWTKDKIGDAIGKGVDFAKYAADLLAHPSKIFDKLMQPIRDLVSDGIGDGPWAKTVGKVPGKMLSGLKDMIVDSVTSSGGGGNIGGTIPTGKRAQIIRSAMAAAHIPPPGNVAQWLAGMNTLITRESGWNPNAINLWDSNAKAGHPSQGLTQTIPGTWSAYVPASLRSAGILDPVANVAASMRYIVSRYGNITNVQQANANMAPAGYALGGRIVPNLYDDGGYLPPGLNLVANGTGRPEPVFTGSQWDDIKAARTSTPQTPNLSIENHVWVGDREITDIVDQRITVRDEATGRALDIGRNL